MSKWAARCWILRHLISPRERARQALHFLVDMGVPLDNGAWREGMSHYIESKLININTAELEDLLYVPFINPALAENIIKYRDSHGGFASIEDLLKVPGMDAETFEKVRCCVMV